MLKTRVENFKVLFLSEGAYFLLLDLIIKTMYKKINSFVLALLFSGALWAQGPTIEKVQSLFEDDKYGAAQAVAQQLINADDSDVEAHYYNAKCSKELFASDAIFLYEKLLSDFPYSNFKSRINKDLALLYYRSLNYKKAVSYFIKVDDLEEHPYLVFKLAYANFSIDSLLDAQYYFSKLIDTESKYAATSQYYYAHIAYQKGWYTTALHGFEKIIDDETFGAIVPYYITQIYFFEQDYEKLIAFANPLLGTIVLSRVSEVNRLMAEAYYRLGDYKQAITHFNNFIDVEEEVTPVVRFLLGQSYFKIEDYDNAIVQLEQIGAAIDSVKQYATYSLGASYLELENYNYALQAFKKVAEYDYSPALQEDAYYNYAKLSFQLDLPFESTLKILKTYLETYSHPLHKKEIEVLMVQSLQSTSKYEEAYDALKDIHLPTNDQKRALQQVAFFLGVKSYNTADYTQAEAYFKESNNFLIDDDIAYLSSFWLADCNYQLANYQEAIDLYVNLPFSSNTEFKNYFSLKEYNLAYAYFQQQEYQQANKYFRKYEKVSVDSMRLNDTYLRIADGFFMSNEFSLSEKYYNKAASYSLFDVDYAIYKRSVALGLLAKNKVKVDLLKRLVTDFTSSAYYDNALYDLAKYYKNISNNTLAFEHYDKLLEVTKDNNLVADAYLSKGMIYFSTDKAEDAIVEFLHVVNNFQQTKYFKEALQGLQSAYVSLAKVDEYLKIINALPEVSMSRAEQDSLTYNTAFMKFAEGDYKVAKEVFGQYMEQYSDGVFKHEVPYYYGNSCLQLGDTLNAVKQYGTVSESNLKHTGEANLFLARYYYNQDKYVYSNQYYQKVEEASESNSIMREAVIRLMYGFDNMEELSADDITKPYQYAKKVLKLEKTDDWLLSRAYLIVARYEFESGSYAKSRLTFEKVAGLSAYDEGAEAKYCLAYLTYLDDSLMLAEQMIFDLADNYNSDHFIAKAFLLLADIYSVQENTFQAKATLESVIENHKGDELVNLARKKWELIVENEKVIKETEPQFFIDVSEEEIDYDLEDFLVEEVIVEKKEGLELDTLNIVEIDTLVKEKEELLVDSVVVESLSEVMKDTVEQGVAVDTIFKEEIVKVSEALVVDSAVVEGGSEEVKDTLEGSFIVDTLYIDKQEFFENEQVSVVELVKIDSDSVVNQSENEIGVIDVDYEVVVPDTIINKADTAAIINENIKDEIE